MANPEMKYIVENQIYRNLSEEALKSYIRDIIDTIQCSNIDLDAFGSMVYSKLKNTNTLTDILELITSCAADMSIYHYNYSKIATYIIVSDIHKNTDEDIYEVSLKLFNNININRVDDLNKINEFLKNIQLKTDYLIVYASDDNDRANLIRNLCASREVEGMYEEYFINDYVKNIAADFFRFIELDKSCLIDDYITFLRKNNKKIKGLCAPIVTDDYLKFVKKNRHELNSMLDFNRDFDVSYFGLRTLERSYLKKVNKKIVERIQHMYMRIAITIHHKDNRLDLIKESYDLLSQAYFTHATPTLFNAGSELQQLSSCFLLSPEEDDLGSIFDLLKDCAIISKYAGGLGVCLTNLRCQGSYINSTQGVASGMRISKVFNEMTQYANQSGKRAGSVALYLELWHGDIFYFLDLKKPTGSETERARDVFLGVMVNDIFMERVEKDELWSLMCPSQCRDLVGKYGDEFNRIYLKYEFHKRYIKQVRAREVWEHVLVSSLETGVPYVLFKDSINRKSNQINIGVINGSNLCAEIVEFHGKDEHAVCNLASICLPKFIKKNGTGQMYYDYKELMKVSRVVCRNLNKIIDINYYPVEKTKTSNLRHRPIGIGVQGLADVFAMFNTPFGSELSRELNKKIFETIYYGALFESNLMAKEHGPYSSFEGSPFSKGVLQFDLWGVSELSGMWDWDLLKKDIVEYGTYNSLLTTCMPTATTSQIMGNNECFEPYTSTLYARSTIAGNYYVVNKYMVNDLMQLGIWDEKMINMIKYYDGSIQSINIIPNHIKEKYKTVWEIPMEILIDMSADRGPFIDQTQSLNLYTSDLSQENLSRLLFRGWKKGLKTGVYYLHTKPVSEAIKFGIDIDKLNEIKEENQVCRIRRENGIECTVCSS